MGGVCCTGRLVVGVMHALGATGNDTSLRASARSEIYVYERTNEIQSVFVRFRSFIHDVRNASCIILHVIERKFFYALEHAARILTVSHTLFIA